MKTSSTWNFRPIVGKMIMGLVVAAMIGSVNVVPSFGGESHSREGRQAGGRNEQRGRGHDRNRYDHGRREYRSYGYRERGYVSPPVIYAPPPPIGVGIFLPSIIIRP